MQERKSRLPKTKSPEQWQAFFDAINVRYDSSKRNFALFYLLYMTGLRIGEALSLEVEDVELVRMRLHVREGKSGERWVPLPDDERMKTSLDVWTAVRARWNPNSQLLFVTKSGKGLSANAARASMDVYAERAGIGHAHPHMLRHSAASELLAHGAPPIGVQRVLGHRRLSTTLNTYAHACDTHAADAMAKR